MKCSMNPIYKAIIPCDESEVVSDVFCQGFVVNAVIQLGMASYFQQQERNSQQSHDRNCFCCRYNLELNLIWKKLLVLHQSLIEAEVIAKYSRDEINEETSKERQNT